VQQRKVLELMRTSSDNPLSDTLAPYYKNYPGREALRQSYNVSRGDGVDGNARVFPIQYGGNVGGVVKQKMSQSFVAAGASSKSLSRPYSAYGQSQPAKKPRNSSYSAYNKPVSRRQMKQPRQSPKKGAKSRAIWGKKVGTKPKKKSTLVKQYSDSSSPKITVGEIKLNKENEDSNIQKMAIEKLMSRRNKMFSNVRLEVDSPVKLTHQNESEDSIISVVPQPIQK
jgi:hypothetical protein